MVNKNPNIEKAAYWRSFCLCYTHLDMTKQEQLDKIARQIKSCKLCKVNKIGMAVPGEGGPDADVMFIGEAPGKNEAKTGRPFIGRAGKLLRELIKEAGLKDEQVFITSPVKYLPEHVTPTLEEIEHGRKHLEDQMQVIKPKVMVLLGRVAVLAVLKRDVAIAKEHGTVVEADGRKYLIAYHPAAPLYSPKLRVELVNDFKKLKSLL